jgi:hypothetical protein
MGRAIEITRLDRSAAELRELKNCRPAPISVLSPSG